MICGIDEAGRGPVMGPMVVAGVWIKREDEKKLIKMGIRDSKKLSPKKREELASYIKKNFPSEVVTVEAQHIDDLRKAMTMNELEAYIFANVANKRHATVYYIDAASNNEDDFKKIIMNYIRHDCEIICEHGADEKYAVVSAASIIAKVERDKCINKIAKELESKLSLPLGSGYPSDEKTITFIKEWIKKFGSLPPYIRKSWKTVRKIENELKQGKLF
ncbi:MAG: ribonuclease HII [Thermoplasmata archaeon]|nr:MAG: ribonuclease HII [Thermoplasmata archaeon]